MLIHEELVQVLGWYMGDNCGPDQVSSVDVDAKMIIDVAVC